ncbi:MAG: thioesterase family protein [Alphaproteobacteria bacterium]|nr:thioesterase family protein [Alphaproteobacteria bacterium]
MNAIAAAAQHEDTVRPEWIDNNDHMNLAYYVLVFSGATDALAARLALPGRLRVTQMHTVYEREVTLGDRLRVATHLLAADASRLHLFHEMFQAEQGYRAATLEIVVEHQGDFPPEARTRIAGLLARDWPQGAGRRIAMPPPRAPTGEPA